MERLFEFSEQLLLHDDLRALARTAPSLIASIFKLRGVALYVRQQGSAYYSDPNNELLPLERLRLAAEEPESAGKRARQESE